MDEGATTARRLAFPYLAAPYLAAGLIVLLLGWAACMPGRSSAQPAGSAPGRLPNVIFIMADDLGYGDLGSYGQERIRTPHLDRMAAEGLRFTQFYAGSTVCAPSRSVLMTGLHTGHTIVRGNSSGGGRAGDGVPLRPGDVTVAEVLQEAGYATGMFGKWGLGVEGTTGVPQQQGFDVFLGYLNQVDAHFYHTDHLWAVADGRLQRRAVDSTAYSHDLMAEEALRFMEQHREEPFFLYLPFTIPHAELLAPPEAMQPYLASNDTSLFEEEPFPGGHYGAQPMPRATYAAMVTHLDRDVGRILEQLETLGLADDTIVFFTSDNGPHEAGGNDPHYFDSNGPLRGIKRDLYEGGIRVPMIAWGPGRVPAGRTSDHVGYFPDVLPTLATLAHTAAPAGLDGISFAPELLGHPAAQAKHDYLYWEFYEGGSAQAVRQGRWKAVRQPMFEGPIELYDLEADVGEANDVAAQHPEVVARMAALMAQAHAPSTHWTVEAP